MENEILLESGTLQNKQWKCSSTLNRPSGPELVFLSFYGTRLSLFFVIFLISEIFPLPEVSFVEGDGWEASVFRVVPRLNVFRLLREEDKSPHLLFNVVFVLLYFWKFLFSYDSSNVLATVLCPLWFFIFTVLLMFRRGRASSLVSKHDLVRDLE